jgi:hypothetical protein
LGEGLAAEPGAFDFFSTGPVAAQAKLEVWIKQLAVLRGVTESGKTPKMSLNVLWSIACQRFKSRAE